MKAKIQLTLILLFMVTILSGQEKYEDKLIRRDGKIITCKVREIGDDEIKYSEEGIRSDVLIGIDKNKVASILFADGRELKISDSMEGAEEYALQRKNAMKFNVFLPISGAYAFSYERSLKPGQSVEAELGIISSGKAVDMNMDAHGFFLKAGFKLIKSPDFYLKGMRYAHILKGAYIRPDLAFSSFTYDKSSATSLSGTYEIGTGHVDKFAVLLNAGKQVVYSNRFAVDWFIGAGYVIGGADEGIRFFAFTSTAGNSFTMSGGVRIGVLF